MRPCCNFICLILFAFCSLARSEFNQGPDKCCYSFSKVRIPVKQVESYYITHPQCHRSGIVFITKAQKEICADLTGRWVQRLKNLVDARTMADTHTLRQWPIPEIPVISSKLDTVAKKAESIRTTETAPLQRPKETTLVHLKESNDGFDFDTTQANPNTESLGKQGVPTSLNDAKFNQESIRTTETAPLQRPEKTTLVHLKESNDGFDFETTQANPNTEMAFELVGTRGATAVVHLEESHYWSLGKQGVPTSLNDAKFNQDSIRTTETTPLQRPEKTTLVHLKESNDGMASESFCTRGTTTLQRADESAVVHLKESAYFCIQPEGG